MLTFDHMLIGLLTAALVLLGFRCRDLRRTLRDSEAVSTERHAEVLRLQVRLDTLGISYNPRPKQRDTAPFRAAGTAVDRLARVRPGIAPDCKGAIGGRS